MSVDPETLDIIYYPNPILRKKAEPVEDINDQVRAVVARMIELMRNANGVGLAAPQIGLPWRLFIANATGNPEDDLICINPQLRDPSDEIDIHEEGCLSIPDVRAQIRRPKSITIEAANIDGEPFTITSDALPARIWQHEVDHLDGVLILDRMSALDKIANRRKFKELEAQFNK